MARAIASPARKAIHAAQAFCLLVAGASMLAIYAFPATGATSVTLWQFWVSAAVGLLCVAATLSFPLMSALTSSLLTAFCQCTVLAADVLTNLQLARSAVKFEPFVGDKMVAVAIALLAPPSFMSGYWVIGLCGVLSLFEYFVLIPAGLRSRIESPEPWVTVFYAVISFAVLAYRNRQARFEREILLRQIVENSDEGAWMIGTDRRIVYVNLKLCEMLGYSREELTGSDPAPYADPESRPQLLEKIERRKSGPSERYEIRLLRRDGKRLWAQLATNPIFDEQGGYRGSFAFVSDETERHALMAEIDSRRELLQGILDNMGDSVFVVGSDRMIRMANRSALRYLGLKSEEDLPLSIDDAPKRFNIRDLEGNSLTAKDLAVVQALGGKPGAQLLSIMRIPGTDRDVYLQSSASQCRDPGGGGMGAVVVLRDVTDSISLDRMKDEFIRVAAHELKTPVSLVKLSAQILSSFLRDADERQKRLLANLVRGSERIDRIARDLLDLSQIQLGGLWIKKTKFDIAALVRGAGERRAPTSAGHPIRMELPATPLSVVADRERITQVIESLLDNAIIYSPEGGEVELKLESREALAVLTVRDHGIGIPADRRAHLFERFYRAHAETRYDYGGMGVGLYLAREIVSRHGGEIGFESVEGRGSSFHFTLPREAP